MPPPQGEEVLRPYFSSPGKRRCFCSACGSPIISKLDDHPGIIRLRIDTLDSKIAAKPTAHIQVASKAEWFEILDGLAAASRVRAGAVSAGQLGASPCIALEVAPAPVVDTARYTRAMPVPDYESLMLPCSPPSRTARSTRSRRCASQEPMLPP